MNKPALFGALFEDDFDVVLQLAAQICETSAAAIAVLSNNQLCFKATAGFQASHEPWDVPFDGEEIFVIPDLLSDTRFTGQPILNNSAKARFFAYIPVAVPEGFPKVGLCISDDSARHITEKQISALQMIASQAGAIIKYKWQSLSPPENDAYFGNIQAEMKTIFHDAIDAIIVMDDEGAILQWNPKAQEIFGWTEAEVKGKPLHEVMIPERSWAEATNYLKQYKFNSDRNITNARRETKALRRDNSEFDIAFGISPVVLRNRRIFICFISDITDRKLVALQLDKQKAFYENILNKLPTDIAVFDADHRYLFVNPGAISVEEYRKYIIGKDDYEYVKYRKRDVSIANSRRARFMQVKNTGKEVRWEEDIMDQDGNTLTHLRRMFPVFAADGELSMVIGFGIEITDRKLLEEKQVALVEQLSAQNTQLIDFCNIVSHNLRAPLVNMSMLVEFIEEAQDLVEQKLLISKLSPVIDNLHSTFNELVESIQIKQDIEIKSEHLELQACLDRELEGFDPEIKKSGAAIYADFDDAPTVSFPPKYLNSIFHNLVSNALKYRSPERPPVIKLESKKINGNILFSITDNGLGIDLVKQKDNIFKIGKVFHRHPNAKGFGLYMTKTQVEAMSSKIWVESIPDTGSTFFIEFANQK